MVVAFAYARRTYNFSCCCPSQRKTILPNFVSSGQLQGCRKFMRQLQGCRKCSYRKSRRLSDIHRTTTVFSEVRKTTTRLSEIHRTTSRWKSRGQPRGCRRSTTTIRLSGIHRTATRLSAVYGATTWSSKSTAQLQCCPKSIREYRIVGNP